MLQEPLKPEEITKSLYLMTNNKSPGADGDPAEFYKQFGLLSPLFHKERDEIDQNAIIPLHMDTAYITPLPKPEYGATQYANDRCVSSMNTDIRIISKALSISLEFVISS